jgi:chemotaxis signal transduction protein
MMTKMVLLTLAGRKFSLSVEQILHVLPRPQLFPLVCLRQEISGVFLYDDEPIPMLELTKLPELNNGDAVADGAYVIVFQSEYGTIGIPVDSAVTIVNVEEGLFEDASLADEENQGFHVFNFQDTSYPLLDIDGMLARLPY